MDEFDDFWSSVGLKDDGLPSDEEVLEQERADARRDREWILEQFDQYRALTDKLVQIVTDSPLDETQKVDLLSALTRCAAASCRSLCACWCWARPAPARAPSSTP